MFTTNKTLKLLALTLAGGIVAGAAMIGCQSGEGPAAAAQSPPPSTQPSVQPPAFALTGTGPEKSGVQLWSENCSRCHNMRPPDEFSAAQWATIVHHMRLRANLTGDEERKITTFLQASN
jgi:hypothetical protein